MLMGNFSRLSQMTFHKPNMDKSNYDSLQLAFQRLCQFKCKLKPNSLHPKTEKLANFVQEICGNLLLELLEAGHPGVICFQFQGLEIITLTSFSFS